MTLKGLTLLLDPVSGHIESPLAMLRDRRKVRGKEEGPNRSNPNLTPHFDPKQDQGVELAL
jgi:hypothetical protein